jgi:HAMP domain
MKRVTILTAIALAALAAGIAGQASLAAPSAQTIRVTETSHRIKLSAKPKPGVVKFVVRNASDDPHDFVVRGGGGELDTRAEVTGPKEQREVAHAFNDMATRLEQRSPPSVSLSLTRRTSFALR